MAIAGQSSFGGGVWRRELRPFSYGIHSQPHFCVLDTFKGRIYPNLVEFGRIWSKCQRPPQSSVRQPRSCGAGCLRCSISRLDCWRPPSPPFGQPCSPEDTSLRDSQATTSAVGFLSPFDSYFIGRIQSDSVGLTRIRSDRLEETPRPCPRGWISLTDEMGVFVENGFVWQKSPIRFSGAQLMTTWKRGSMRAGFAAVLAQRVKREGSGDGRRSSPQTLRPRAMELHPQVRSQMEFGSEVENG